MIINSRLKEIASWPASYYENGIASSIASIETMDNFLKKLSEVSTLEPFLYPTHSAGLVAEWSLKGRELTVEIHTDGTQLHVHGLRMLINGISENTANSKDDTEVNELLTFMRQVFDNQETIHY
jgi:hypothetical protein